MTTTAARAGNPSNRLTEITECEVEALSLGCAPCGGGGDPYLGSLIADEAIRDRGPVTLLDLVEFDDDQILLPIAIIGAPTILAEKLMTGEEGALLRTAFEKLAGVSG